MNELSTIRKHLGTIRQIAGELMLSSEDGGLRSGYPSIRTIAGDAIDALSRLESSAGKPVVRKSCSESCGPGDFYPGGKCDRMGCYTHPSPSPAPVELSEEDIEEASHNWANAEPPWPGPVERTYARTVFKDGIRHITKHYTLYPKQP